MVAPGCPLPLPVLRGLIELEPSQAWKPDPPASRRIEGGASLSGIAVLKVRPLRGSSYSAVL